MSYFEAINNEINNLRKLLYFVESDIFKTLYKVATPNDKFYVDVFVEGRDTKAVKAWIDNQRALNLNTMSLINLRQTARGVGIIKVERFNKDQLISLIIDKRRMHESNRRPATS